MKIENPRVHELTISSLYGDVITITTLVGLKLIVLELLLLFSMPSKLFVLPYLSTPTSIL